MSLQDLLAALRSSKNVPREDLKSCLCMKMALSSAVFHRAAWTMQSPRFQGWKVAPKTCTLLINGDDATKETCFAIEFVSASLLESLAVRRHTTTLHFFCSLHTASEDSIENSPIGLVRGFIVQLLWESFSWNLGGLSKWNLRNHETIIWKPFECCCRNSFGSCRNRGLFSW